MSVFTSILNLIKPDSVADANQTFNLKTFLNDNWDKLDIFAAKTITTDKLVNNLAATQTGFGLDATQGKAIQDEINVINTSLSTKAPLNSPNFTGAPTIATKTVATTERVSLTLLNGATNYLGDSNYNPIAITVGNLIVVTGVISVVGIANNTKIASVPLPKNHRWIKAISANGVAMTLYIRVDGSLEIGGATSFASGDFLSLNFSYERA